MDKKSLISYKLKELIRNVLILSFIIIVLGFAKYLIFRDFFTLFYTIINAIGAVVVFPALVCFICFKGREKNIWFYPLSHVVVFGIYTTLMYYWSIPSRGGFIGFSLFNFNEDFPFLFKSFLIYFIPALIAAIGYRYYFKKEQNKVK